MYLMQSISVAKTRQHLAEILGKVAYGGETFIISKKGRPMAQLVPVAPPHALAENPMTLATMPRLAGRR